MFLVRFHINIALKFSKYICSIVDDEEKKTLLGIIRERLPMGFYTSSDNIAKYPKWLNSRVGVPSK